MLLLGEGFHDAVINGTLCDDVLHHYGFGGLTLPPETGYSLLIQFQTPSQPEPHQRGAAGLKVESMSCRCGVDQRHRDFTVIPSADAGGVIQAGERNMQLFQSFRNAGQVMLEPVSHQDNGVLYSLNIAYQKEDSKQAIELIHFWANLF